VLFSDRETLCASAYGSAHPLAARLAIYRYQQPRHDFRPLVASFLGGTADPLLDIGCGTGGYTRTLRDSGHAVVACDLSAAMATSAGGPAALADAMALPFTDGSFGAVIALHMLYHVPAPEIALAEIRRVLRPGGTAVVSTNALGDKAELRQVHADAAARAGCPIPDRGPTDHFDLDAAESAMRRLFDTVERHDLRSEVRVPEPEPVVAFIDSTRAWYGDGPEVLPYASEAVSAAIARDGAFTFRTHSGFLVGS
jgi:SAM-dependent methyltransferase